MKGKKEGKALEKGERNGEKLAKGVGEGGRRSVRFILPGTIGHKSAELAKALSPKRCIKLAEGGLDFVYSPCSRIGGRGSPINQRRECFGG